MKGKSNSGINDHTDPLEQAAEWFAILQDEKATDIDREHWRQWLQANEAHREAWGRVERIDRQFRDVSVQSTQSAREILQVAGQNRRRLVRGLASAAIAAPLGWIVWRMLPTEVWQADIRTVVGEIRDIELPDGSRLWLNTDSAVDLDYQPAYRRLVLITGEIHLHTAPDNRPLRIDTPFGNITPLGTRFTVRLEDEGTYVSVTAGKVAVTPQQHEQGTVLEAGQALTFDQQQISVTHPATTMDDAWRKGILVADNLPLGDFLDQLARYRHGVIRYDERAAGLKLVGAYPLEDTDRILDALEESLPVTVTRLTPWWVRVTGHQN